MDAAVAHQMSGRISKGYVRFAGESRGNMPGMFSFEASSGRRNKLQEVMLRAWVKDLSDKVARKGRSGSKGPNRNKSARPGQSRVDFPPPLQHAALTIEVLRQSESIAGAAELKACFAPRGSLSMSGSLQGRIACATSKLTTNNRNGRDSASTNDARRPTISRESLLAPHSSHKFV